MTIYKKITINENIERKFKPTRLAVKELNGLKYFCKTVQTNIEKYTGSGTDWVKHVKKYGKKNIKTIWVSDWFYCPHHIQDFAMMFSEYNNIVEDTQWANKIPENGLTGMTGSKKGHMKGQPKPKSDQHKIDISNSLRGITLEQRHGKLNADKIKKQMSESHKGKKLPPEIQEKLISLHRGRKRSQETIDKMIAAHKNYKKYKCEYCLQSFLVTHYNRWHGAYCKENPLSSDRIIPKSKQHVSLYINGVFYPNIKKATLTLGLPDYLIRKMLKTNKNYNEKYKIFSLILANDVA
jgi:hypothetical protein